MHAVQLRELLNDLMRKLDELEDETQPLQTITIAFHPAIEHGDFRLYECQAILRYIDAAFDGPRLTPLEPKAMARMSQVLNILDWYVMPSLTGANVLLSLVLYVVVYLIIFPTGIYTMLRFVWRGPAATEDEAPTVGDRPKSPIEALASATAETR